MADDHSEFVDDILSEILTEARPRVDASADRPVTFGQELSPDDQDTMMGTQIDQLATALEIPAATAQLAKSMTEQYRTARGSLEGTALEMVATAAVYAASKLTEVPLDPTDFVDATPDVIHRKGLLRRSKDMVSTLGLDPAAFLMSEQYIDRYVSDLELPTAVGARAKEIVTHTEDSGLSSGKSPSGWAAAAVYNACLDHNITVTQTSICDVANVSAVTIRNRYQEQREAMRAVEALPDEPTAVIARVSTAIDIGEDTTELATILIDRAHDEAYPITDAPIEWALGALWQADKWLDDVVSIRTLGQYHSASSATIRRRATQLREVFSYRELNEFRGGHHR